MAAAAPSGFYLSGIGSSAAGYPSDRRTQPFSCEDPEDPTLDTKALDRPLFRYIPTCERTGGIDPGEDSQPPPPKRPAPAAAEHPGKSPCWEGPRRLWAPYLPFPYPRPRVQMLHQGGLPSRSSPRLWWQPQQPQPGVPRVRTRGGQATVGLIWGSERGVCGGSDRPTTRCPSEVREGWV